MCENWGSNPDGRRHYDEKGDKSALEQRDLLVFGGCRNSSRPWRSRAWRWRPACLSSQEG